MSEHASESSDRREALRSAGRWLALGGLTVLSGGLIVRSVGISGIAACCQSLPCNECREFGRCGLPRAQGQTQKPSN